MKKDEAIRILTSCAAHYSANLESKNVLYVFQKGKDLQSFEALFLPRHYLHLTGIKLLSKSIKSTDFYRLCLKRQLSPSVFTFHENGTTDMKLSVLSQIVNIHKTAKMVGDYDNTKSVLITEKIVGTVTACIGFVRDGNYYHPNTTLREDIRTISVNPQKRVLAIYTKENQNPRYTKCTYLAKNTTIESFMISDMLKDLIDFQ